MRIISATHRNLLERVEDGSFREDLYYRLNGLEIELPALRERSDKSQLLDFILAEEAGEQSVTLEPSARQALLDFAWPGNVRQLRNVLRTLVALCDDSTISLRDLPNIVGAGLPRDSGLSDPTPRGASRVVAPPLPPALQEAERSALLAALEQQRWHMTHVAAQLGVSRNTLYRKLRKHGIARSL
ncbi:Acetoin catabolism regulatory protein [compost metagenome]